MVVDLVPTRLEIFLITFRDGQRMQVMELRGAPNASDTFQHVQL